MVLKIPLLKDICWFSQLLLVVDFPLCSISYLTIANYHKLHNNFKQQNENQHTTTCINLKFNITILYLNRTGIQNSA